MPNFEFTTPFTQFPNFDQQLNSNSNVEGNDDEEAEELDKDENLGND